MTKKQTTLGCFIPNPPGSRFAEGCMDKSLNKPFDFSDLDVIVDNDMDNVVLVLREYTVHPDGVSCTFEARAKEIGDEVHDA